MLYCTEDHIKILTLESHHMTAWAACKCTWLLTTGRSGTEWLTHALNALGPFRATHEPFPTLFYAARSVVDGTLPEKAAPHVVLAARSLLIEQSYTRGLRHIDTSPRMTPLAPSIRKAFSAATFIHLSREPRAFVRSALARHWYTFPHPQEWWWPHSFPESVADGVEYCDRANEEFSVDNAWKRLIWYWNETHRDALAFEAKNPHIVHRVKAEDLWTKPEAMTELLAFLGAGERFANAQRPALDHARTKPRNVGEVKGPKWTDEMEAFLLEQAGETMEEIGYP